MNTSLTPTSLFPVKVTNLHGDATMLCGDEATVNTYLACGWTICLTDRSHQTFAPIIADHIYEAYKLWGDDDMLVADEILSRAGGVMGGICNEINRQTVTAILKEVGGTRAHQAIHQFTMSLFTNLYSKS